MHNNYKRLRIIKDEDELQGYANLYGKKGVDIFINIEWAWKEAKRKNSTFEEQVDYFINIFEAVSTHEILHWVVRCNYKVHPKWELGEEIIIWSLMEESLTAKQIMYYLDELKYVKPCRRKHVGDNN